MHAAKTTEQTVATPRFAILGSGRGSNAESLMRAFKSGFIPARLVLVASDKTNAPILDKARAHGVTTAVVERGTRTRDEHEAELLRTLRHHDAQHLLLAGYMRLLSGEFLQRFSGRVLNIHPSLLPDFPGLHAVERQWQQGVKVAGATVHLVDEGVDTGPPLLSGSIEVRGDEGPDGLAQRILLEVEHVIYPRAVLLLCQRLRDERTA